MGWFIEHELPVLLGISIPILLSFAIFYTFREVERRSNIGDKIGFSILGIFLIIITLQTYIMATSNILKLF